MIIRNLTLAALAVIVATHPASATCLMSYCKDKAPSRLHITNIHRQIVGDIYDPGTGRIQIRDKHRRILGYIERDGTVTNTHRQKIGTIELDN